MSENANPQVEIVTNFGSMVFELFEDEVPNTVANFIRLAEDGYFDGTRSHRLIQGFMVQLGDPYTKDPAKERMWGTGDPGYKIPCEHQGAGKQRNLPGTLSMAKTADPDTGGSQFFINDNDNSFLDNKHTVFGQRIEGEDVRERIMQVPTGAQDRPQQEIKIEQVKVRQKRDHAYTFKTSAGEVR